MKQTAYIAAVPSEGGDTFTLADLAWLVEKARRDGFGPGAEFSMEPRTEGLLPKIVFTESREVE